MHSINRFFYGFAIGAILVSGTSSAHAATTLDDLSKGVDKMFQSRSADAQAVYKKTHSNVLHFLLVSGYCCVAEVETFIP